MIPPDACTFTDGAVQPPSFGEVPVASTRMDPTRIVAPACAYKGISDGVNVSHVPVPNTSGKESSPITRCCACASDTEASRHAQQMSTMLALRLHPRFAEELMSPKRMVGLVLVAIGMVILLWGGVFWTDRDTIVDAGPLEIQTEDREGVALPPIIGALALVGGVILVLIPSRRRI